MRARIDRWTQAKAASTSRLEVDGGVKVDNIAEIRAAGADTFVAGSAIFGHPDYAAIIRRHARADRHRPPHRRPEGTRS